jgi:predicted amidohydrolase YtcJ
MRIPLLHDHHSHPLFYSAFGQGVDLQNVATKEEANDLLVASARKNAAPDRPILTVAHGWRSNRFTWTREELESLPPVAIFNVSLHSLLMNDAARTEAHQQFGSAAKLLDDRDWYESNLRVVLNWFANLNASAEGLIQFFDELGSLGVHSAEEMLLVDEAEIRLFEETGLIGRTKFWAAPDTFETLSKPAQDKVTGLKLFTDGAIGSRTAAMSRPYLNNAAENENASAPANLGMLIFDDAKLLQTINDCLSLKPSLAIHAIGDRAIEQVIHSLETIRPSIRHKNIRIEHAQMISRDQAIRAKSLGVCLSMQPNFNGDSVDYVDRIDAEFCAANNPFRMLIDDVGFVTGKDLIFGSDGMPHGAAVAAQQSFFPSVENQILTLDEFKSGYACEKASASAPDQFIELQVDEQNQTVTNVS